MALRRDPLPSEQICGGIHKGHAYAEILRFCCICDSCSPKWKLHIILSFREPYHVGTTWLDFTLVNLLIDICHLGRTTSQISSLESKSYLTGKKIGPSQSRVIVIQPMPQIQSQYRFCSSWFASYKQFTAYHLKSVIKIFQLTRHVQNLGAKGMQKDCGTFPPLLNGLTLFGKRYKRVKQRY